MVFPFLDRFTGKGLIPNTDKVAIPVGYKRPETLAEQVARLVRTSEFARQVQAQGLETFEESDDFDVVDDFPSLLPDSPWQDDHELASVGAMQGGVVQTPRPEEITKSKSVLQKARDGLSKRQSKAPAGVVAQEEDSSGAPQNSEEESSS